MIELGGNITLNNFDNVEPVQLIVVKKMVGNCAKKISDENKDFKKLSVDLKNNKSEFEIEGKVTIGDKEKTAKAKDKNLFYALSKVLEDLTKK